MLKPIIVNPLCISKKELIRLFLIEKPKEGVRILLEEFSGKYTMEQILLGVVTQEGEVGDYYKTQNKKDKTSTVIAEVINAIALAGFYFLESESSVCFEMKSNFKQKDLDSYRELIDNLESNTEIDFLIKDNKHAFKFQLKQYPEEYKEWSPEKVITYIENRILPKYNNDSNKDLIIVITIQPKQYSDVKESDLKVINDFLNTKWVGIKLAEINFIYNQNNEYIIWYQVFPKHGYYKIDLSKLFYYEVKKLP